MNNLKSVQYKEYTIKYIYSERSNPEQGGFAFVVCLNGKAIFHLGVKVFMFITEDITDDIKNTLYELGFEKIKVLIDDGEHEKYNCYQWTPNTPLISVKKDVCYKNKKWNLLPSSLLDSMC